MDTDGGALTPLEGGSDPVAPHQCPLESVASYLQLIHADVFANSILMTSSHSKVPGHSTREQVIPWRAAQPLKLMDLARIKLIGLSKKISHGIPKSVQTTVSMLDYDKEVFISPSYHGSFLERMYVIRDALLF